uniref:HPP transmembrane region domain-containing protein n=1 Tax=Hemiselmis tepida TaxID=464990 RepID=A0A7S0VVK0_9CRYP
MPVGEAHRMAAASLFHSSVAIPIWDLIFPHPLTAVIVLYTPLEYGEPWVHDYLDPKRNPKLVTFLRELTQSMPLAIRWMHANDAWSANVTEFVQDPRIKARRTWRVLRILVRTGWVRICKSDNTPKTLPAKARAAVLSTLPFWENYLEKWKGQHLTPPPRGDLRHTMQTLICSFGAMLLLSGLHQYLEVDLRSDFILLLGSFAAVITLIHGAPNSPYSQPRMVMAGHLIGAVVGVSFDYLTNPKFGNVAILPLWIAVALAPSVATALMAFSGTTHPPAAACCLIYVVGDAKIKSLGWLYLLFPCLLSGAALVLCGLVQNNVFPNRKYPLFW